MSIPISLTIYTSCWLSLWRTLTSITNKTNPLIAHLFLRGKHTALNQSYKSLTVELGASAASRKHTDLLFLLKPSHP